MLTVLIPKGRGKKEGKRRGGWAASSCLPIPWPSAVFPYPLLHELLSWISSINEVQIEFKQTASLEIIMTFTRPQVVILYLPELSENVEESCEMNIL
jgi:hypothetical protein